MKKNHDQQVRLTLSIDRDFFEVLEQSAHRDFLKVATFVKRHLMKTITPNSTEVNKCITNGKDM